MTSGWNYLDYIVKIYDTKKTQTNMVNLKEKSNSADYGQNITFSFKEKIPDYNHPG